MVKLNLGCGRNWRDFTGFDGVDSVNFGQEYVWDLENGLPFIDDNSIEEVRAWNVLEHIHADKVIPVMNEVYRVCKVGAKFHIKVPKAPHTNAFSDPTHRSFWTEETFTYFTKGLPNFDYGIKVWNLGSLDVDDRSVDVWLIK